MTDLPMLNLGAPAGQTYPRPITAVHQVEVTTFCSLRCVYCPSPKLEQHRGQPKMHMDLDVFARTLEWAKHFETKGTQGELSITGIGETLLHPEWKTIIAMAREALPTNYLNFSTNGLALDDDACAHLAKYDVKVFVSLHRPEKAGPAIERAKRHGIYDTFNASAAVSSMDWAGQVDWHVSAPASRCEWLAQGWCNVLVDGRVSTCCLDASGVGVVGHVDDEIGSLSIKPYELCGPCHQQVP
jgi:radical SAM family protein